MYVILEKSGDSLIKEGININNINNLITYIKTF